MIMSLREKVERITAHVSAVHPLIYLGLYLAAIPAFAGIYLHMPDAFYASNAKLEHDAREDLQIISEAIRRVGLNRLSDWHRKKPHVVVTDVTYEIMLNHVRVEGLVATDERSFDARVWIGFLDTSRKMSFEQQSSVRVEAVASTETTGERAIIQYGEIPVSPSTKIIGAYLDGIDEYTFVFSFGSLSTADFKFVRSYLAAVRGDPVQIRGSILRMMYFSVIVIATVGFGDIVPISDAARAVVMLQAFLGVVLIGLFLNAVAYRAKAGSP
jgi:hypothetical protein